MNHVEFARARGKVDGHGIITCTASDTTFGGLCMNCGYKPERLRLNPGMPRSAAMIVNLSAAYGGPPRSPKLIIDEITPPPQPFEQADPELGELLKWYCNARTKSRRPMTTNVPVKRTEPKVDRNAQCPCGSGRKYKKCHGA